MPAPTRRSGLRLLLPVLLLAVAPAAAPTADAPPAKGPAAPADGDAALVRSAAALYEGIHAETLPNGLRVYLKPVPGSPVVTTMVAYKVGSADEQLDQTGLSHYLEHLMFKGTEKLLPGDIDRLTQRGGGRNNAYTSEDYTVFHFDFAADRWQAALEIEADRMRNLRIDEKHEFQQEKGAVIAELHGNEDNPWELEYKLILPPLFGKEAPYGHPIIGEAAHVEAATAAVIKKHYDRWYHPNNAALVIVGGFDEKEALAAIKRLFGPIPKAELPARRPEPKPVGREETVRRTMPSKFSTPRLLMGFNGVKVGDPDFYALEVLERLLTTKTGRLYKRLVDDDDVADSVTAYHNPGRYPGWFAIQVELRKGKTFAEVEKAVTAELKKLADDGPTPEELKRARRGLLAHAIFHHEGVHDLADSIARGVSTNDLDYLKSYLPRVSAVSSEDLRRVARKYFIDAKGVVVRSEPAKGKGKDAKNSLTPRPLSQGGRGGAQDSMAPGTNKVSRNFRSLNTPSPLRGRGGRGVRENAAAPASASLQDAKRVVLPNGLTLLLLENHRLPIVVADVFVKDVYLREPPDKVGVAALIGEALDEGSKKRRSSEISRVMDDVGGVLDFQATGGSVKVLTPDTETGLDVLFDCLVHPTFPSGPVRSERQTLLAKIDDEEQKPESRANRAFHTLVYGPHPYGRPLLGERKMVAKLTAKDCRDFHAKVFVPNNTLVAVVGDIDPDRVVAAVTKLTADWKRKELPPLPAYEVPKPKAFTQRIITDPSASQLHVYLGHVGVRRDNPDYYKLLVMDHVLGMGSGFTDRLSANLRDRQGLAYSVSASITDTAAEEPGTFLAYVGTFPDKLAAVKAGFEKEVKRLRAEPPGEAEVAGARSYLIGSRAFRLTTNADLADQLVTVERFRLGFGYLDDFRKAVAAVTPADVQAAAKKYLDPDHLTVVAAGPIDENGRPLKKE